MAIVDGHIRCSRCRHLKPVSEFQPSIVRVGCGACRDCKYAAKRAYEQRNPERVNAARNEHRKRNHAHHREVMRAHYRNNLSLYRGYNLGRYGITPADYDALLADQGGACACCGSTTNRNGKRLFVDHDHETGAIRGILCLNCNRGLAALGDTIVGVRRALAYLERAEAKRRGPILRINLLTRGARA